MIAPSIAIASLTISVNLLSDNLPRKIRDRTPDMSKLVEIKNLHVEATTDSCRRIEIIKGVDIEICQGEIVALIAKAVPQDDDCADADGLYPPRLPHCGRRQLLVDGKDMAKLSEPELAGIRGTEVAYVPQSAAAAFNPSQKIMDQSSK